MFLLHVHARGTAADGIIADERLSLFPWDLNLW